MDRIDAEARAVRAQQILDDPLVQEALAALEGEAVGVLVDTDLADEKALVAAAADLQAARRFRRQFRAWIEGSKNSARPRPAVA